MPRVRFNQSQVEDSCTEESKERKVTAEVFISDIDIIIAKDHE